MNNRQHTDVFSIKSTDINYNKNTKIIKKKK